VILRRETKAGKPRYGVRVDIDGRQIWVGTFKTRGEAQRAEAHARSKGMSPVKTTCDEWVTFWLEGYADRVKASSYNTAESALSKFSRDFRGVPLGRVSRVSAEQWARQNRWRVPVVVTVLNAAVRADLITKNPFEGLSQKGPGRKHNVPLSPEEVERLANIAGNLHGPTMRAFVLFTAYSALRVGEVFALEWGDIDFDRKRIMVRRRLYQGSIDLPKSNRIREVVLTPPARDALLGLDRSTEWVFPAKNGGRMSQPGLSYYWQGITAAFGRKITPHELKHFAGYYLHVILNLPPRVVAAQLGHTDGGRLVERLYGHGDHGALEEIDRAFENVIPLRRASHGQ